MTTAEKHEFPMARTCPFTPPSAYEEIREEEPVSWVRLPDGGWAWVVSRHEDVRTVLNDRRFSVDRQHPDSPVPSLVICEMLGVPYADVTGRSNPPTPGPPGLSTSTPRRLPRSLLRNRETATSIFLPLGVSATSPPASSRHSLRGKDSAYQEVTTRIDTRSAPAWRCSRTRVATASAPGSATSAFTSRSLPPPVSSALGVFHRSHRTPRFRRLAGKDAKRIYELKRKHDHEDFERIMLESLDLDTFTAADRSGQVS